MELPKKCLIWEPDGTVSQVTMTVTKQTVADEYLRGLAKDAGRLIRNMLPDTVVYASGAGTVLAAQKKCLVFNSHFRLVKGLLPDGEAPLLIPSPSQRGRDGERTDGAVAMTLKWDVPPEATIWFFSVFNARGEYQSSYQAAVLRDEGRKKLGLLPLCNIFDDGKCCLGDGWDIPESREGAFAIHKAAYRQSQEGQMNTDLMRGGMAELFRWTADKVQVKLERPLGSYASPVSNTFLNWILEV